MLTVGLDWATEEHALCILDDQGNRRLELNVSHTAKGLAAMLRRLRSLALPEELPIAIERPSGLIVDVLVDAGYPVVPIHPNILKANPVALRCSHRKERSWGCLHPGRLVAHRWAPLPATAASLR